MPGGGGSGGGRRTGDSGCAVGQGERAGGCAGGKAGSPQAL